MHNARDEQPSLPADTDALRTLVLSMMTESDALTAERNALLECTERLHHLLRKLNRLQFGRKSERLPEDQRQLALEEIEQAIAQGDAEAEKHDPVRRKQRTAQRRARRGALPAHRDHIDAGRYRLPVLPGGNDVYRRRHLRAAGCYPGAVSGDRDAPA